MEKTLKELLENFIYNFDVREIERYFGAEFCDDSDKFEKDLKNIPAIDYITNTFYEIDCECLPDKDLAVRLKVMLEKALELLKN